MVKMLLAMTTAQCPLEAGNKMGNYVEIDSTHSITVHIQYSRSKSRGSVPFPSLPFFIPFPSLDVSSFPFPSPFLPVLSICFSHALSCPFILSHIFLGVPSFPSIQLWSLQGWIKPICHSVLHPIIQSFPSSQSMWAERSGKISRLSLSSIYVSPARRSVPAPTTSRSRSAHAPIDFLNPAHSSAPFKSVFGQLRSRSDHMHCPFQPCENVYINLNVYHTIQIQ